MAGTHKDGQHQVGMWVDQETIHRLDSLKPRYGRTRTAIFVRLVNDAYEADRVPRLEEEVARLRAEVEELRGRVPPTEE